ncbi:MAG: hypothetical protein R3B96_16520 [Pirellulaceae bacterium]
MTRLAEHFARDSLPRVAIDGESTRRATRTRPPCSPTPFDVAPLGCDRWNPTMQRADLGLRRLALLVNVRHPR